MLDWSAHPIGNVSPYLSEEESILVGRLKKILSSLCAIKEMTELWLVEAGLSPASRDQMDLSDLRGMPKVSGGKAPPTRPATREVDASPAKETPKASSKMSARWRGLKNSMKVWNDSSAAEELERGLLHPQLAWELYTLPSEVLLARVAKEMVLGQHFQMALFDRVHDVGRLITFMDYWILQLQQVLDALKSGGGPKAVAKVEERASELQEELEKTRKERDEALLRRETSEKELHEVRSNLAEVQRLLKEVRVRTRKMDDELLQAVKALESARAELLRQAIVQYKESLGFKEGLKRMGRVTYEYGYRVALARFHARHPDAEVEEDPFTIHPEDDLVPMERQQAFDDSVPPEP
ncbi:hypothetical protein BHE74_00058983 [Ensete ventricosum]|nr:hypothetical protein BHE74_00058983 [Ensete ventricosum]